MSNSYMISYLQPIAVKTADNFNKRSKLVENNIAYGAKRKEIVPWELKPITHIHLPEDI